MFAYVKNFTYLCSVLIIQNLVVRRSTKIKIMEKILDENGETMWVYDNFIDNKMQINICNFIFNEYSEIPNMNENHEYWEISFIEFLLMDFDDFFENLKYKMHIEVPEELERIFEKDIIYLLNYWFRERTVREHYFDF